MLLEGQVDIFLSLSQNNVHMFLVALFRSILFILALKRSLYAKLGSCWL